MTQVTRPVSKPRRRSVTELRTGLDEQYIAELRKDPAKWEEFRRAGKALFAAVNTLAKMS